MGKYWIFLLALWVAAENGVIVPVGVIAVTLTLAIIGVIAITIKELIKAKER